MEADYIPKTIEECYEYLDKYLQDKDVFKNFPEEEVMGVSHMTLGRFLRNRWNLWWSPELYEKVKLQKPEYPSEIPELVKFFHEVGVNHPDDMSGLIILSYHRKINGKNNDLHKRIEEIIKFYNDKII